MLRTIGLKLVSYFADRLRRRIHHLKRGDREVRTELVKRDLFKLFVIISWPILFSLAILLRMTLRILKPWVQIRFCRLWSFSLGLLSIITELYLCERDAGMHPKRSLDLFYHYHRFAFEVRPAARRLALISNRQLDRMVCSKLRVWEPVRFLYYLNQMLPGGEDFSVPLPQPYDRDGLLDKFPLHLKLTPEEEERGTDELRRMGITPGAPFVCFHAKDSAWHRRGVPRIVPLYGEWFQDARKASIHHCLQAMQELTALGYFCVRMGKYVEEPMVSDNPRIIDYATRFHSDFMDVYLSSHCAFFIGGNSGIIGLPIIFRRPLALANLVPFTEVNNVFHETIFIPKRYHSGRRGRPMSFCEILSNPRLRYGMAFKLEIYEPEGIHLIENSPDEIAGLAVEMHERLAGTFRPSREDEELQRRFFNILRAHADAIVPVKNFDRITMGAHFLRKHRELLEGCEHVKAESCLVA